MGIVDRLKRLHTRGLLRREEPVVERDVAMENAKRDALKVVSILKNSPFQSTMAWDVLIQRFAWSEGCSKVEASKRLESALNVLTRSDAVAWAGIGSEVSFSRSIPVVVL